MGTSLQVLTRTAPVWAAEGDTVVVHAGEEAWGSAAESKPRIAITNASLFAIEGFLVHYYFTAENGQVPVLADFGHQIPRFLWNPSGMGCIALS